MREADDELLRRLPLPVAQLLRRTQNAKSPDAPESANESGMQVAGKRKVQLGTRPESLFVLEAKESISRPSCCSMLTNRLHSGALFAGSKARC